MSIPSRLAEKAIVQDALKKKRVSSGIPQLDDLLGGLFIGDNVVWYEDAGSFSTTFCVHFIRESLALKKPIVKNRDFPKRAG